MDDLDDITDEERALAEALAQESASLGRPIVADQENERAEFASLLTHAALLRSSGRSEASPATLARGRAEVLSHAQRRAAQRPEHKRWYFWLPVPAAFALLFVFFRTGLDQHPHEEPASAVALAPVETETSDEDGFEPLPPRYHLGQTPSSLLKAQAEVLRLREVGAERTQARAALEREMRLYRGTLIASLELGGR